MTQFNKPALSLSEQIELLQQRGLYFADKARAERYLSCISYYRLSAYTRPFYIPEQNEHRFMADTSFDTVLNLYIFDRELRLLLLDAIERIEVALRTQLSNTLAEHYGAHGYLDANLFNSRYNHNWLLDKLNNELSASDAEPFVVHYRQKYTTAPSEPPIWMVVELLSFKEVSLLFANLRNAKDTQRIESYFGWKFPVLKSWFRSLSDLRNICAHQGRVWNREFGSRPELPKKAFRSWPKKLEPFNWQTASGKTQVFYPTHRLYMQLVVIESLLQIVSPDSTWATRLAALLQRHPNISQPHMGFPPNWEQDVFWQAALKGN